MVADWIRRQFTSAGITQFPPGDYLPQVQGQFGGAVMLMIDVSGSMYGQPIENAVIGARAFVREAVEAGYKVGVMLWHTTVVAVSEPDRDPAPALGILTQAAAGGGNALDGPLFKCHDILNKFTGDRVVALFGDGDLTPKQLVLEKVAVMKADNIRFVTRGLGATAAEEFGSISDEDPETARVESVDELASGIASMASSLKSSGLLGKSS